MRAADIVGLSEIADMLGVEHETAHMWRRRGILPAPLKLISGRVPIWARVEIERWAKETNRTILTAATR